MTRTKVKYDPQTDILRVRFNDTPIEDSEQVEPGMIVDYDVEGHVVGFELLDASDWVVREQAVDSTAAPGD